MERTIILVGLLGPLGTWENLVLAHGDCGGGRLKWESEESKPFAKPRLLRCDACGQVITIVDRAALVRTARTGQQFCSEELLPYEPAACPQRYEPMAQQFFEKTLLEDELKEAIQENERLKCAMRDAILGLKMSRSFAKSKVLRDIREALEAALEN